MVCYSRRNDRHSDKVVSMVNMQPEELKAVLCPQAIRMFPPLRAATNVVGEGATCHASSQGPASHQNLHDDWLALRAALLV